MFDRFFPHDLKQDFLKVVFLYSFIMEPYDDMKEHSFLSFHKYLHVKYINGAGPIFIGKRRNLLSFHHTAYIQSYRIAIVMNRKYSQLIQR